MRRRFHSQVLVEEEREPSGAAQREYGVGRGCSPSKTWVFSYLVTAHTCQQVYPGWTAVVRDSPVWNKKYGQDMISAVKNGGSIRYPEGNHKHPNPETDLEAERGLKVSW